jgi:Golgi apparatus protein 1
VRNVISLVSTGIAVFALLVASPNGSNAETDIAKAVTDKAEKVISKIQASCATDIKSFCSQVTPGEGRLMLCMMAHEDKLSDKCFTTLVDVGDAVELTISSAKRAASVCRPEINTLCAGVEAGGGQIAQCLITNKAKLSGACSAEVAGLEARIKN